MAAPSTPEVNVVPSTTRPILLYAAHRLVMVTALTVMLVLAECCRLPDFPTIDTVYVPGGVEHEVDMVAVDKPEPLTEGGSKLAETPGGNPDALSAMFPPNPFSDIAVAWKLELVPGTPLFEAGVTDIEKSADDPASEAKTWNS